MNPIIPQVVQHSLIAACTPVSMINRVQELVYFLQTVGNFVIRHVEFLPLSSTVNFEDTISFLADVDADNIVSGLPVWSRLNLCILCAKLGKTPSTFRIVTSCSRDKVWGDSTRRPPDWLWYGRLVIVVQLDKYSVFLLAIISEQVCFFVVLQLWEGGGLLVSVASYR